MSEWQNSGDWKDWFEITGADGVDFHALFDKPPFKKIFASYTKEGMMQDPLIPKTAYTFWRRVNGKKYYIDIKDAEPVIHNIDIRAPVNYIAGHLRSGYYTGRFTLTDDEFQAFLRDPVDYTTLHLGSLKLDVSDYDIDDVGDISSIDWNEIH